MADLATMKARIANEIARTDLTSEIASAIASAIDEHEHERLWFNENRSITFATVADQEFYTSSDNSYIPDLLHVDYVRLEDGGNIYTVKKTPYWVLEGTTESTDTGRPSSYAYYQQKLRFYPIPDSASYTIRISAHVQLGVPSADSSSNAWTTEAEQLIRYGAKKLLYEDVIRDANEAAKFEIKEAQQLDRLRAETAGRVATSTIYPTEF